MWLLYSRATTLYSSREEARSIFIHMQHKRLGIKSALFYIAYADFELQACNCDAKIKVSEKGCSCITKARNIIDLGLQNLAEPIDKLKSYPRNLECSYHNAQMPSSSSRHDVDSVISSNETPILQHNYKLPSIFKPYDNSSSFSSNKAKSFASSSTTAPTILDTLIEDDETLHPIALYQNHEIKSSTDNGIDCIPKFNMENDSFINQTHQVVTDCTRTSSSRKVPLISQGVPDKKIKKETEKETTTITRLRSVSRPQLGPPLRVQTLKDLDIKEVETAKDSTSDILDNMCTSKPLTRADIGYMLDWKPTGPRPSTVPSVPSQSASHFSEKEEPIRKGIFGTQLEKIDEDDRSKDTSKASSKISNYNNSTEEQEMDTQPSVIQRDAPGHRSALDMQITLQSHIQQTRVTSSSSPESLDRNLSSLSTLKGQVNPMFLPLACEENIVHVNGQPYMKLSVIGSGASCKVYRAISKDKAIVAIKKVKREEMSKKALEGYANEIDLLRKLQGCPFIIQMYDSEVDAHKKLIYVVMELGEIDLNHVVRLNNDVMSLCPFS